MPKWIKFSTRYASAQVLLAPEFLSAEYIEGLGILLLLLSGSIVLKIFKPD